jgi:cysteinyl-tRNA synthetase
MGMTDIDDKIVKKAKERKKSTAEVAVFFENDFFGINFISTCANLLPR